MKNFKRIIALALVLLMGLSLTACHKKDEIAVRIGDTEFTSAYYMCALVSANSEAKSKVYEDLTDEEKSGYVEVDYTKKKIEDKPFVEWVEEAAMKQLYKTAAYKALCAENKLELDEEALKEAKSNAQYYWSSYGYSAYFEPNGVSYATYEKWTIDSYYYGLYFDFLYGAEGEKAIAADTIKENVYSKFVVANVLTGEYTSDMSDDQKATLKNKFNDYATALKEGRMTFEEVYNDHNGVKEEESTTSSSESTSSETTSSEATSSDATSSDSTETKEEEGPKDQFATLFGAEGTGDYENEYYEDIKKLALGEVSVFELSDNAGLALALKQDIKADEYYITVLDSNIRHMLADDEFDKLIEEYYGDMESDINKFAISQFKVKKIEDPAY